MRIKSFKEFFSYGIIGIVNTGIHFLVFFFATKFFSQALSNSLAFTVAVVFSFFCNSIFTFKKKTTKVNFVKMYFSMLMVSVGFGYIGDALNLFPLFTIIIYLVFNPIIGFAVTKYFVFK